MNLIETIPSNNRKIKNYSNLGNAILDGMEIIEVINDSLNTKIIVDLFNLKNDYEYWQRDSVIFLKSIRNKDDHGFSKNIFFKNKPELRINNYKLTQNDENYLEELKKVIKDKIDILRTIKEISENKNKEKESFKIKGLIKPIKWQEITIIYNGESVKIKQNDTLLEEYNLESLGMPKLRKIKTGGVHQLFTSLFFPEYYDKNPILLVEGSKNQKNKSNLSKILRNVFETNIDPIYINKKTGVYTPLFRVSFCKDFSINDHPSGRQLRDTDGAFTDDSTD